MKTRTEKLEQIEKQRYQVELENRGIPGDRIRSYGFAFEGKKVFIKGGKTIA